MGYWNGTCMISNLPIISGEKIKLIFLLPKYSPVTMCGESAYVYPTDILTPCLLPISGKYDDYGSIEG